MDPKVIGYIFKDLRHQRGLTLRQVSEEVGIDYSYLSKIETGVSAVQQHQFTVLSDFYGVTDELLERECDSFFDDLEKVFNANLQHKSERKELRTSFLEKYSWLQVSQYLPYLHLVELETLSYQGKRTERFYYLVDALKSDYFISPYDFFLMLRKLYWACIMHNTEMIQKFIPVVEARMETIDKKYQPFGYYYLLTGCAELGDNIKLTSMYSLAHAGFMSIHNNHFGMLTDIIYGGHLVLHRDYRLSIKFNSDLLANEDYEITAFSKKSIHYNIGEAYLQLNDIPHALEHYRESYALVPQKNSAFYIAYCLFCLGLPNEALQVIDDAAFIVRQDALFNQLLLWLGKYIKRRKDSQIKKLEQIEMKNMDKNDYCLRLTLLKIKIAHYRQNANLEKENEYLYKMIKEMQNS